MSYSSEVKEKRKLGFPRMRSDGWERTAACITADVAKMSAAYRRYPERPRLTMAAQVAASNPPEREPSMPGEQYLPPVQSVWKKYWALRRALSAKHRTLVPLRA